MKVYLGSKNIVKINATKEVLEQYGFEVVGVDVDSKVSSQPKCDQETIEGAYNRAKALPKNSFRIGLEAGIEMLKGQMYLTNFGVLIDPNDNVYRAGGTRIVLPNEIAKLILEDKMELSDAMETYFNTLDIKHKEGAIGYFTNNLVVRKDIFVHIVKLLYGQYLYHLMKQTK